MKILVVYDSKFGNTEKVAHTLQKALTPPHEVTVLHVDEARGHDLAPYDLLVVGSPTHGGQATPHITLFLNQVPRKQLTRLSVACYDTRLPKEDVNMGLKVLMSVIGYAAPKMGEVVTKRGGQLLTAPEGFLVQDKEGPLVSGEVSRIKNWLKPYVTA